MRVRRTASFDTLASGAKASSMTAPPPSLLEDRELDSTDAAPNMPLTAYVLDEEDVHRGELLGEGRQASVLRSDATRAAVPRAR